MGFAFFEIMSNKKGQQYEEKIGKKKEKKEGKN